MEIGPVWPFEIIGNASADAPAAPGLVPGDRDVHEPLEEIALVGPRGAPGRLERLVRREVLAGLK